MTQVAALYVETGGTYFDLPGIDPWDSPRDARGYEGPWPVVAHPPCQRWGRFWHGSPLKPHQFNRGDDAGCFAAALYAVRTWGGVLEHPAGSSAWEWFGLPHPSIRGGWTDRDRWGGAACHVEQGHYGHEARKATWLYACRTTLPDLQWGTSGQRIAPEAIQRWGYARARRHGVVALIGGKDKTRTRNATPRAFRDLLIGIARTATAEGERLGSNCAHVREGTR